LLGLTRRERQLLVTAPTTAHALEALSAIAHGERVVAA
jgi:hypothetical protein